MISARQAWNLFSNDEARDAFVGAAAVPQKLKDLYFNNKGNAIAIMTFGAIFSLIMLAAGIYAINMILTIANITSEDALYTAMQAIPGGVVTVVGVVILAISLSLIAVAMAIFASGMGQTGYAR